VEETVALQFLRKRWGVGALEKEMHAGYDDESSQSSGSDAPFNKDMNFTAAPEVGGTSRRLRIPQPEACTKTVYLQLMGDKYRINLRSDASWNQLKTSIEGRLGLPPETARLKELRAVRDGALIRSGADLENGEYIEASLMNAKK
jgi:hypothetical protein